MQQAASVRKALYVLFARLLAGAPDADLYTRLHAGPLSELARLQGVDLWSDLRVETDAIASAAELDEEYRRLSERVSLHASDYPAGTGDPLVAIGGFLREHKLELDASAGLAPDHLSVMLGVMGALADGEEEEANTRRRAFYSRHLAPWWMAALAAFAEAADRRFYRGLGSMLAAFLASEERLLRSA